MTEDNPSGEGEFSESADAKVEPDAAGPRQRNAGSTQFDKRLLARLLWSAAEGYEVAYCGWPSAEQPEAYETFD